MPYFQWHSRLQWFGTTLGCSAWLAIAGVVLATRGFPAVGAVFVAGFALLGAGAMMAWTNRARYSAARAWQLWLLALGVLSLAAVLTTHLTGTYHAINLDEGGLVWMYAGIAIGVPLLIADGYWRERTDGHRGVFGALFDIAASWF